MRPMMGEYLKNKYTTKPNRDTISRAKPQIASGAAKLSTGNRCGTSARVRQGRPTGVRSASRHGWVQLGSTLLLKPSSCTISAQDQSNILAAEPEAVRKCCVDDLLPRLVRDVVEVAFGVGV